MGVVYRAEDLRLGRTVALKFLHPGIYSVGPSRERFLLEAKAASALNHPGICTIYGIEEEDGNPFIVMECVEGETLREKLKRGLIPPEDVMIWGAQIADGLGAAHDRGIVHRDIKPENLIVRTDGRAQILDFGLAKWRGGASITVPGSAVGTLAYMSPEQIQGRELDGRTDIFALGSVMYELLAGRTAFAGGHDAAILYEIMNADPPAIGTLVPGLAPECERVVMRCLAKLPDERFQTARQLSSALRSAGRDPVRSPGGGRVSTGNLDSPPPAGVGREGAPSDRQKHSRFTPIALLASAVVLLGVAALGIFFVIRGSGSGIESLAILPLRNASADSSLDYLTDGLTESIISRLSRLSTMRVMSRSSVFHYKGKEIDPQAAGKALGVQGVLVGGVTERGEFVTISVELLNTRDNTQIWGEQFRRKETELFALQDDVSREIVQGLRLRLTSDEKEVLAKAQTSNAEAYDLFLKGRYHWNKRNPTDLKESIRLYREALDKDPGFAAAYAALASSYTVMVAWGYIEPGVGLPEAEKFARKAMELDDRLSEAHSALAGVEDFQYDRIGALREFQRAVELNPNDALAYQWYAEELAMFCRFDESYPLIRRARELDPLSFVIPAVEAVFYANARRMDEAVDIGRRLVELDPSVPMGHLAFGLALTRSGKYAGAIHELEKGVAISDSETTMLSWLGCAYALGGRREDAVRIADKLDALSTRAYISPFLRALIYTSLGDKEKAFTLLDAGVKAHDGWMGQTYEEVLFDPLRNDPRYTDIVRRLGLAR